MKSLNLTKYSVMVVLVAFFSNYIFADGFIVVHPPRPEVKVDPLAVKYHNVSVDIDNQIATTTIEQEFVNINNMRVEGTYIFPIAEDISIEKFSMWINGQEQQGEILESDKARKIYEDIVRSMRDPALLEYIGTKMFKLRIFPIEAKESKKIKITYSGMVKRDNDICFYRYPLNTERFSSKPIENVVVKINITSSIAIKNVYSTSHNIDVVRKSDFAVVVGWEDKNVKPDKDLLLYYTLSEKDLGFTILPYKKSTEDGFFLMLLSPKYEQSDKEMEKDIIFIVDTSGSMADGNKIGDAKKALKHCVSKLNSGDRFNIITFATGTRLYKTSMQNASQEIIKDATDFIESLRAAGGTNIYEAFVEAFKFVDASYDSKRPFIIVFVTDGYPTVGDILKEKELGEFVKKNNTKNIRMFSLGVGYDVNSAFINKISDESKGFAEYVTPEENLEVKFSSFYDKFAFPALTDVKFDFQGIDIYDMFPKNTPDIFRGSQLVLFGRYRGSGHRAIRVEGKFAGKKEEFIFEATFPESETKHDAVPRLWAASKVAWLLDKIRIYGESQEVKNEIIELAKTYGILTPYSSYLILEDIRRGRVSVNEEVSRKAFGGGDKELSDGIGAAAREFKQERGEGNIGLIKSNQKLKYGYSQEVEKDFVEAQKAYVQNVADKTFYLGSDNVWYDSTFNKNLSVHNITFLSKEHLELLDKYPELRKYARVGKQVAVTINNEQYLVK